MRQRLLRGLLRIEGLWWMMRVNVWMAIMTPAGTFAARHTPSPLQGVSAAGATIISGGLAVVINDILDRHKDDVTAPDLPLPSGIVSLRQAIVGGCVLAISAMGLWAVASVSWVSFASALAVSVLGGVLVVLYSLVKPYGVVAPVVGGCAYAAIPAAAWLAAGGGEGVYPIAPVLVYAALIGTGGIVHAAIRDVDSDADVGNRTVAVRYGARRALQLGAALYLCSAGCVLGAGFASRDSVALGVAAATLAAVVVVLTYRAAARQHGEAAETGRIARVRAMRPLTMSRLGCHLAFIAVAVPALAAVVGIFSLMFLPLQIAGYRKRIYGGGLRGDLERQGA